MVDSARLGVRQSCQFGLFPAKFHFWAFSETLWPVKNNSTGQIKFDPFGGLFALAIMHAGTLSNRPKWIWLVLWPFGGGGPHRTTCVA